MGNEKKIMEMLMLIHYENVEIAKALTKVGERGRLKRDWDGYMMKILCGGEDADEGFKCSYGEDIE